MGRIVLLLTALAMPQMAAAQDVVVYGGVALEFVTEPGGDDGGDGQTFEAYVEAELNGFYAGVWGLVNSVSTSNEVNLYLGYRNALDSGFDYDLSYYRYYYPNDGGNCCGEIGLSIGQTVGDYLYVSAEGSWDPEAELGSAYLGAEVYPADKVTIGVNWGVYNVEDAADEQEWDIGLTYDLLENDTSGAAIDLRYYDGTEYDGYYGLFVNFDTTLFGG
jgi:uncharacterized protein (TIGR02001 family)